jgi:four helix bundle protein
MSDFEDLKVWQKARTLAVSIYELTRSFPRSEIFGLTQQMRRCAISIFSNIAEGRGRYSRPESISFLVIARGSTLELEAQLLVSQDLEYIDKEHAQTLVERCVEIAKMINGMIRYFRSR